MGDDVERKGLGTPATRADTIEKLVKDGFVRREKKQMMPTLFRKVWKIIAIPKMARKSKGHSIRLDWNFRKKEQNRLYSS